jgi:hypothetical protein
MPDAHPTRPRQILNSLALVLGVFFVLFLFVLLVLPPVGIVWGIYSAHTQDRDIRSARPVQATVVSSRVIESNTRSGRSYSPEVVYRYEVGGRQYTSDRVMLLAARGRPGDVTAEQFVAARPPGARVAAYYVPRDPARAFLSNEYDEAPYVIFYVGFLFVSLYLAAGAGFVFYPKPKPPPAQDGWTLLRVRRPLHGRVVVNLLQGAVCLGLVGWAAWHYLARVPGPHGLMAYVAPAIFSVPGIGLLVAAFMARATHRMVSDARVLVREEELRPGGNVRVRLEQDLRPRAALERVRVGLVCERTKGSGRSETTEIHWQTWTSPPGRPAVKGPRGGRMMKGNSVAGQIVTGQSVTGQIVTGPDGGRRVVLDEVLRIPPDQPASSPEDSSQRPKFNWKLVVETALAGCPDYRERFDVRVRGADDDAEDRAGVTGEG